MTTKWLSRQGDPIQGHLHAANQQKKSQACSALEWLLQRSDLNSLDSFLLVSQADAKNTIS